MVRKINILDSILNKNEIRVRYSDLLEGAVIEVVDDIAREYPNMKFMGGKYSSRTISARMASADFFVLNEVEAEYPEMGFNHTYFETNAKDKRCDNYLYGDFNCRYTANNRQDLMQLAKDLPQITKELEAKLDAENKELLELCKKYNLTQE